MERCIHAISSACYRITEANHLDLRAEGADNPSLELADQITTAKSAPIDQLIGPIVTGLATDDAEMVQTFTDFGAAVGAYAALNNDLNDALPESSHKSDVRRRKKTFPIVFLMTQTPEGSYEEEKVWLRSTHPMLPEQEAQIRHALVESGAVDYTSVLAEAYRHKARNLLRPLEEKMDVSQILSVFGILQA